MKGTISEYKDKRGYGWVTGENGVRYFFHFNDLKEVRKQKPLIAEGKNTEFEIQDPQPEAGPAIKERSLRILEESAPAVAAPVAELASKVSNLDANLPLVSITHRPFPGHLDLIVSTGRVNDQVQLYVKGQIPSWVPKVKKDRAFRTGSDGTVRFAIPLTDEEYAAGILPLTVFIGDEMYVASWSREPQPAAKPPIPTPPPPAKAPAKDVLPPQPPPFSVRDVTGSSQKEFKVLEITGQDSIVVFSKLGWEIGAKIQGETEWQRGQELAFNVKDRLVLEVRIEKRPAGQFGSDYVVVKHGLRSGQGKEIETYFKPDYILLKETNPDGETTVH